MNRSAFFFGLSSVVALAGFAGACSSTTTTLDNSTPEGGTTSEAGGGKDAAAQDSSPIDTDTGTTATGDEACAAETTKAACGNCCITNHAAGAKVIQDSVLGCACKGTGADGGTPACMTECATTACNADAGAPNTTCTTCLQGSIGAGGACQAAASSACTASADCLAEQKCIMPCTTKN